MALLLAIFASMATIAQADIKQPELTSHETSCYYSENPSAAEVDGERGRSYRGLVTFTISGRTCAKWTASTDFTIEGRPDDQHEWSRKWSKDEAEGFSEGITSERPKADREEGGIMYWGNGLGNHNYCRNPDMTELQPWCVTLDGKKEVCDIPKCDPHPRNLKDEAASLARKMKSTDCHCAAELYGEHAAFGSSFLEKEHIGRTSDGQPCRCK
jgi:hypothetical protein